LLNPKQSVAARDELIPDWNNLTYDEKQLWKAKMEVYAAMLDRVDQGIGKLMTELKKLKKDDNTLIIFISDNEHLQKMLPILERLPAVTQAR
jgi:arylsulfatase